MNRALQRPPQPLVWINGWPAVGKQTVAQCLVQLLGQDCAVLIDDSELTDHLELPPDRQHVGAGDRSTSAFLSRSRKSSSEGGQTGGKQTEGKQTEDNQIASSSLPNARSAAAVAAAAEARLAVCFQKYVQDPATLGRVVIFTDCCADDADGAEGARAYRDAAARAGRPFVAVYIDCRLEENVRRTQMSERRCSQSASKICSAAKVRELRARTGGRLYLFPEGDGGKEGDDDDDDAASAATLVAGLCVNVTDQPVHEAALQILAFVRDIADQWKQQEQETAAAAAVAIDAAAVRARPI